MSSEALERARKAWAAFWQGKDPSAQDAAFDELEEVLGPTGVDLDAEDDAPGESHEDGVRS